MKTLTLSALVSLVALTFSLPASASQRTIEHIDRALGVVQVEMQAIYSGRYQFYRPDTVRRVIGQISNEASSAQQSAESVEARRALGGLLRSLQEEYSYSFRFQFYRLESTRLLMVNYQRFLRQARQSESLHGSNGGNVNCMPPLRIGCLN